MAELGKGRKGGPTTPESYPTVPGSQPPGGDYSYTVELVGSIQHELGKLTEAVGALKTQSKEDARELKEIAKDVHAFKMSFRVSVWLISGIFAASAAVIGFLLNHLATIVQAYFAAKKP